MSKHGKRKEGDTRKRENGRPAVVADLLVGLHLPIETRQAVLAWAKDQPGQPNLSEAIRRLIDIGLSGSAEAKQVEMPAGAPDKATQVDEGGQGDQSEPGKRPQGETDTQYPNVVERTTGVVRGTRWSVESTPQERHKALGVISALALEPALPPKAQSIVGHPCDNKPRQMPEDVKAFNEYWTQAEHRLGRHLNYEEVVVLFNQDRPASNYFIED